MIFMLMSAIFEIQVMLSQTQIRYQPVTNIMPRIRLLPVLFATVCFLLSVNHLKESSGSSEVSLIFGNKSVQKLGTKSTAKSYTNNVLLVLSLILSSDIHPHPGPAHKNVFRCGLCQIPVTWSCEGVCCDGCDICYHKSCTEHNSTEFAQLHQSNVAWHCYKCDSVLTFQVLASIVMNLLKQTASSLSQTLMKHSTKVFQHHSVLALSVAQQISLLDPK